jgi:hypothetical protein
VQDLTEHASDVDLDAALQQTHERHGELARARDRKRRLAFGGGVAAVVVLAVAALPLFLANDDGGTVGVADDGGEVAPVEVAPQVIERWTIEDQIDLRGDDTQFDLSADGDVWVLTRKPETVIDFEKVESGGAVVLGGAPVLERAVDVISIEGTSASSGVRLHFDCPGGDAQVQQVRYRVDGGVLIVRGDVMGAAGEPCVGDHAASVQVPLPETLNEGLPFVVDPSL